MVEEDPIYLSTLERVELQGFVLLVGADSLLPDLKFDIETPSVGRGSWRRMPWARVLSDRRATMSGYQAPVTCTTLVSGGGPRNSPWVQASVTWTT